MKLPSERIKEIVDEVVSKGNFKNLSEAYVIAIQYYLDEQAKENQLKTQTHFKAKIDNLGNPDLGYGGVREL